MSESIRESYFVDIITSIRCWIIATFVYKSRECIILLKFVIEFERINQLIDGIRGGGGTRLDSGPYF